MEIIDKFKQLDEIFEYDGKNETPFSINNLLKTPRQFLSYCYDFSDRTAEKVFIDFMYSESENYDKRVEETFDARLDGKKALRDFCLTYIDHLDLDRMTLLVYDRLKNATFPANTAQTFKKQKRQLLEKLKDLMKKNIKSNAVIYEFIPSSQSKDGMPHISSIDSDSVLGIHGPKPKMRFISDEQYNKYMKYFTFEDVRDLMGDNRLYSPLRMYCMDLLANKELSDSDRVKLLMNESLFKNTIDPSKYLLTLNYGIVDKLKNSPNGISLMEFLEAVETFKDVNLYVNEDQYLDVNYKDAFAGRNFLAEFGEISSQLTDNFLEQEGSNIDTLIGLGLITKNNFKKYFPDSIDKESTLSIASSFGLISNEELKRYCRTYSLDEQEILTNTFNSYLEANDIRKTDYVNWPVDNEAFRKIIPKTELNNLVSALIKNATKNPDSTIATSKLYMLVEDEIVDESFFKKLYLNNDISFNDIKTLNSFYEDYNISTLYGFEQSTKQMVSLYKYLYADIISKSMEQEGDKFEEKPIFVDPDEYLLKENYEFQRKLFRDSPKNVYTKNRELEDELDYLILYSGIAKHLYHQGLIDVRTLKDHIDDTGEIPEKRQTTLMVLNGEISNEDLPFLVKGTTLEDNPLLLTQLYDSGNITYREILEKYLAGNISYNTLLSFGDGRDLSSSFNEERFIALLKNAINSSNEDKAKLFVRYKKAFQMFMPHIDRKKIYSKQKSELSKSSRRDKFAKFYRENVIDGKNLLDLFDYSNIKSNKYLLDTLADLIKTQDLTVEDCELLFKDSKNSTVKRDRLEYIFNNYSIPNELKMKVLLDTYIENTETDLANYDYLLKKCLSRATEDKPKEKGEETGKEKKAQDSPKKEQELMPYPLRYRDIVSIDPSMTSKILGSKILFHSNKYNKYIFEQMYTTKHDLNLQLTTHATYVLSEDLVEQLDAQLFARDKDGNITDFDYRTLIDAYRYGDKTEASKTLHKSKSWISQLKKKITGGHKLAHTVLEHEEDNIEIG